MARIALSYRKPAKPLKGAIIHTGKYKKPGEGGLAHLFCHYKNDARKRGHLFTLTLEEFTILTSKSCEYCGTKPEKISYGGGSKLSTRQISAYYYNGIDRKDNSQGYIIGNCATCCKQCNYAKKNMPYKQWISWLNRIATTQISYY